MFDDVVSNVKKIAVLRSLVLGDLVFSLPAFDALHKTYPDAELVYIGRTWHARYIPGRIPGITRVEVITPSKVDFEDLGFLIDPAQADDFFRQNAGRAF